MKKIITTTLISLAFLTTVSGATAHMMGGTVAIDDHTAREEAEGRAMWDKLQAKQITCADVSDEDFGALGEYFMGLMLAPSGVEGMGNSHAAMNQMMVTMMGEEGEEQAHIVMGKRLSGCDPAAVFPSQGAGFMPMMNMMTGGWSFDKARDGSSPFGFNSMNTMMNVGFGPFGGFGWIFMILWWVLIIAGIAALIKWLVGGQIHGGASHTSALDILKERYAKGEIDKKEFEDKKKDLS